MAALHAAAFDAPWPAEAFVKLLETRAAFALVALADAPDESHSEESLGFVLAWAPAADAEILTLAVAPAARRQGVGAALTRAALAAAARLGAQAMLLEVAEDNAAARALYARLGFVEAARRRGYYARRSGGVDALVLRRTLVGPHV
ncbi:MAG: GNAT family N-acetyltransferase [Hyphomonadaceae bacterium]